MLNSVVSDNGEYVCVLKNDAGSTQSACTLVVQAKKDMESEFRSQSLRQVETVQTSQVRYVKIRAHEKMCMRNLSRIISRNKCVSKNAEIFQVFWGGVKGGSKFSEFISCFRQF